MGRSNEGPVASHWGAKGGLRPMGFASYGLKQARVHLDHSTFRRRVLGYTSPFFATSCQALPAACGLGCTHLLHGLLELAFGAVAMKTKAAVVSELKSLTEGEWFFSALFSKPHRFVAGGQKLADPLAQIWFHRPYSMTVRGTSGASSPSTARPCPQTHHPACDIRIQRATRFSSIVSPIQREPWVKQVAS